MNPEEVVKLLRQHALELIEFYDKMSAFKNLSKEETDTVLSLCLYLIEQLAEHRWFTSDLIEIYDSGGSPVFMQNENLIDVKSYENTKEKSEFENPPFDLEFFSSLEDL